MCVGRPGIIRYHRWQNVDVPCLFGHVLSVGGPGTQHVPHLRAKHNPIHTSPDSL
jgi:hypothetical protein